MSDRAELRLALVCYGGLSLAVYMHGVTKELHKLVEASRRFDDNDNNPSIPNPFTPHDPGAVPDSEKVYYDILADLARRGRPLSVAIDVIGGTSAGGINGVVLAKAVALNASQEKLRQLWIDEAQLSKLLYGPDFFGLKVQTVIATMQRVLHMTDATSLLKSDVMSRLLLGALRDMDTHRGDGTLIPDGGSLELYVTTTDVHGYSVAIPTGMGGRSQRDRGFAQVMEFSAGVGAGADGFSGRDTYSLAFAARATSAFPVAFASVSMAGFDEEIASGPLPDDARDPDANSTVDQVNSSIFRFDYAEAGTDPQTSAFIDGGLLDNAPFDLVVDAIARKPAQREVIRRLIYIEPDPERRLDEDVPVSTQQHHDAAPVKLLDIKNPLTSHPFLNDLIKLRDMNTRIASIGAISERLMGEITARIATEMEHEKTAAGTSLTQQLHKPGAAQALSDRMHTTTQTELRPSWNSYQRMKATSIAERLGQAITRVLKLAPQSSTSTFITAVLTEWVRQQPFWETGDPEEPLDTTNTSQAAHGSAAPAGDGAHISDFLRPRDTLYRERRLMFILIGVNDLYKVDGGPPRHILDGLKTVVWEQLSATQNAPERALEQIRESWSFLTGDNVRDNRFDAPGDFVTAHSTELATLFAEYADRIQSLVGDGSTPLWEAFAGVLDQSTALRHPWRDADVMALASRYLGFPRWDALLYPVVSLSELPQFTPIPVSQFSPIEATALDADDSQWTAEERRSHNEPKLFGKGFHHFGAFLDPSYRENDYLWGRLDAAELIVEMLMGTTPTDNDDCTIKMADAFSAIYEIERPRLTKLPRTDRNTSLRGRITELRDRVQRNRAAQQEHAHLLPS